MHPVLFGLGPITIYSYGFFLALAYMFATYVFWREGKKQGYQEEKLLDFSIISLLAALVGGRVFYVLINLKQFSGDLKSALYVWEGGFAYYGSLVFVFLTCIYFIRKWRWSFLQVVDIGSLSVLVAIIFAKIGSFLSGNDYGTLTKLPWGVTFSYLEGKRHPVQLYEAVFAIILLITIYSYYKRNIKSVNFRSGAVFFYFLLFNSLGRFAFEFFRGDSSYLGPVKLANVISLILAGVALFSLYFYQFRNFGEDKHKITKYIFGLGRIKSRFRKGINEPRAF